MMPRIPLRYLWISIRPLVEDLAATAVFYILFVVTGNAVLAASIGLAIGAVQLGNHLRRRERPPTLLMLSLALTVVLGGVTMVTDDPRFLLIKPAIVYVAVGSTMLPRGWARRYMPTIAHELLPPATIDWVGWSWAALMFATALANLALVATLPPRTAATVLAIGGLSAKLLLFAVQYRILSHRARRVAIANVAAGEPASRYTDPS